jgi:hypothetical protein
MRPLRLSESVMAEHYFQPFYLPMTQAPKTFHRYANAPAKLERIKVFVIATTRRKNGGEELKDYVW